MHSLKNIYKQELIKQAEEDFGGMSATFEREKENEIDGGDQRRRESDCI